MKYINFLKIIIIAFIIMQITVVFYVFASGYDDLIPEVFNRYYEKIASKDLDSAYSICRDPHWQSGHSCEQFKNNWSNNKYIELLEVEVIKVNYIYADGEIDGGEAEVKIRIYSEDYKSDGTLHKGYYTGKAYCNLYFRGGPTWLIEDISVAEE